MNIIVFVTAMVMVVAIMTYARVETYRNFSILESQFEAYMNKKERDFLNRHNNKFYNDTIATQKEVEANEKENKIAADSKLTFALFVNKQKRAARIAQLPQYFAIAKNLIHFLYKDTQFYQEAEETFPDLPEQILDALILASDNMTDEQIPTEPKDLANIKLHHPLLDIVFAKMLKGTEVKGKDEKGAWEHFLPKEGYLSLLDFISLKDKPQIRIFLASPQLLMAIFEDEDAVKQVLKVRKELYLRLTKDSNLKAADLEPEFAQIASRRNPAITTLLLNFQLSKTDPGS